MLGFRSGYRRIDNSMPACYKFNNTFFSPAINIHTLARRKTAWNRICGL